MGDESSTAFEFVMNYGWAILVVLSAVGALAYFGVLTPGVAQSSENNVTLFCRERLVFDLEFVNISFEDEEFIFDEEDYLTFDYGGAWELASQKKDDVGGEE